MRERDLLEPGPGPQPRRRKQQDKLRDQAVVLEQAVPPRISLTTARSSSWASPLHHDEKLPEPVARDVHRRSRWKPHREPPADLPQRRRHT
jgi:hypothetical protein